MKTNICQLDKNNSRIVEILNEAEKIAAYNALNKKQTLQLRLLAEELVSMLPELLESCEGTFWIENDSESYELHVSVKVQQSGYESRERALSLSTSGKNAAAVGIMGKIRAAAEILLYTPSEVPMPCHFYNMGMCTTDYYGSAWSLYNYMKNVRTECSGEDEAWDELEKSIVAKLADDVIVGVRGKRVDIVVKKKFI